MACDTAVCHSCFFHPLSTDSSSQLGALIDGIARKARLKIPRFKIARIEAGMHSFKLAVQHDYALVAQQKSLNVFWQVLDSSNLHGQTDANKQSDLQSSAGISMTEALSVHGQNATCLAMTQLPQELRNFLVG